MKRSRVMVPGILAGLVLFGLGAAGAHAAEARPLNLVMVLMTCGRADHMSFNGYKRETTPNLNRLAETGTVFLNAFSQAPTTEPSTASIMTSRYPASFFKNAGFQKSLLDSSLMQGALVGILKNRGYATASFGGYASRQRMKAMLMESPAMAFDERIEGVVLKNMQHDYHGISRWLEEHREGPFFLLLQGFDLHEPHVLDTRDQAMRFNPGYRGPVPSTVKEFKKATLSALEDRAMPLDAPEAHRMRHEAYLDLFVKPEGIAPDDLEHLRALYDAQVYEADAGIGRVLEVIESGGLKEKTLIVILSEHGQLLGEHGLYAIHWGGYDGTTHVPLIIRDPRQKRSGRVKALVSLLDVMPTVLELLGLPIPENIEGRSLVPLMRGEEDPGREEISIAYWAGGRAIRTPKWKLIFGPAGPSMLFNVARDPKETVNVIEEHPKVVRKLRAELEERSPFTGEEPPPADPREWMRQESYW